MLGVGRLIGQVQLCSKGCPCNAHGNKTVKEVGDRTIGDRFPAAKCQIAIVMRREYVTLTDAHQVVKDADRSFACKFEDWRTTSRSQQSRRPKERTTYNKFSSEYSG